MVGVAVEEEEDVVMVEEDVAMAVVVDGDEEDAAGWVWDADTDTVKGHHTGQTNGIQDFTARARTAARARVTEPGGASIPV